jgi:hypothetical protein
MDKDQKKSIKPAYNVRVKRDPLDDKVMVGESRIEASTDLESLVDAAGQKMAPQGNMAQRLAKADPEFSKVVPEFLNDNGPVLSNTLLAALAEPKKGIVGYKGGKYAEAMRRNVQANIATAQKFVVSNSLVEHAFMASMSRPKYLIDMLRRGIPAFSNMWIEWDEDFRQDIVAREMAKAGVDFDSTKTNTADRMGYHIMTVNDQPLYMPYYDASKFGHDGVHGDPMGFHLFNSGTEDAVDHVKNYSDPEKLAANFPTVQGKDPDVVRETITRDLDVTNTMLLGGWYHDKHKDDPNYEFLNRAFVQIQAASMHWNLTQQTFSEGWTAKEMMEIRASSLTSQAGDGRFLIALLGLLNYDLIVHERVEPPIKVDHVRFGRKVPKNEYKVVTIQLPKPRGKRVYEQMFTGHGTPKKEHWRRGHWRTVRDKSGRVKKRVWIGEMKVGNPELGTIVHDYKLEGK